MTKPLATNAAERKKARDALATALDLAEEQLGEGAVAESVMRRYDLGDNVNGPTYDDLEEAATALHEGHDDFRPETCRVGACRDLAIVMGRR